MVTWRSLCGDPSRASKTLYLEPPNHLSSASLSSSLRLSLPSLCLVLLHAFFKPEHTCCGVGCCVRGLPTVGRTTAPCDHRKCSVRRGTRRPAVLSVSGVLQIDEMEYQRQHSHFSTPTWISERPAGHDISHPGASSVFPTDIGKCKLTRGPRR